MWEVSALGKASGSWSRYCIKNTLLCWWSGKLGSTCKYLSNLDLESSINNLLSCYYFCFSMEECEPTAKMYNLNLFSYINMKILHPFSICFWHFVGKDWYEPVILEWLVLNLMDHDKNFIRTRILETLVVQYHTSISENFGLFCWH